ncbi:hypothetical protein E2C01_091155 [Portunus trituberculatus]|uniref:Uncharacterized protein n=1 Tax=Portunus trituberculatus TaxID=210409 RepID=A0A5B7JNM6_PORTR|nr:hypothetical protein [Portunus trituberculatus]
MINLDSEVIVSDESLRSFRGRVDLLIQSWYRESRHTRLSIKFFHTVRSPLRPRKGQLFVSHRFVGHCVESLHLPTEEWLSALVMLIIRLRSLSRKLLYFLVITPPTTFVSHLVNLSAERSK